MVLALESATAATPLPRKEPFIPPQWADAMHSVASASTPPIVVICGPKNSGKSTFSRLLLNALLESYDKVGFLDTDVGQPEFFVPGCLSLHLLDERLSDLMSTSMKTPERCLFFGDISSKRDPKAYTNCMFRLYKYFLKNHRGANDNEGHRESLLPLIINTAGWVKGTGFDVLVEFLRYVSPTHVIQIHISAESKNLPNGAFWLVDEQRGPSEIIKVHSAIRDSLDRSLLMLKNAHVLRDHQLYEYFKQCFPRSLNIMTNKELAHALTSIPPYQVHFSQVKIVHLHCQVPKHEVFHSLNGTIVGLAASSIGPMTSIACTPWCVGLGIVRAIDVKKSLLYVITPVPLCELEKVDHLLQGFIQIPDSLLQVHGCVSPYMSTNVLHKLPYKNF